MLNDYFHVCLRRSLEVVFPLNSTVEVFTLPLGEICLIPGVPPAVLGVVNRRGKLLWIVELSDLLGLAPSPRRLQSHDTLTLVVLTARSASSTVGSRQLGCVVSSLKAVVPLDSAKFQPVSTRISPTLASFLSNMAEVEQSPIFVLNTDAVLTAVSVSNTSFVPL